MPFSSVAIISPRKRELACYFTLNVLLLSCGYYCSVIVPCSVVSWSVVLDCSIFWPYSLIVLVFGVFVKSVKSNLVPY